MSMTIHCDIVSAEEEIFSGLIEMLVATGDMGELGERSAGLHAEAGASARAGNIDALYTIGKSAELAARAYGAGARHCAGVDDLVRALNGSLGPDTTVLVKGSRFMRMERVVEALTAGRANGARAC